MLQRGERVQIVNPKHKHHGKCGQLTSMDRGNVYVKLDDGRVFCTRMNALAPAPKPTPLAEFTKQVHEPELPWCEPCQSYHAEVRDVEHAKQLKCFAYRKEWE